MVHRFVLIVLDELAVFLAGQIVIERFGERVGGDEVTVPLFPGIQDFFLLPLVERFPLLHAFLDRGPRFPQHLYEFPDVIEVRDVAVAGDDFHVSRQLGDDFLQGGDHAFPASARTEIDKGKSVTYEVITHVYDIRLGEEDDAVAIGVAAGEVQRADVFAVQVHGDVVIESDDGKRFFRGGFPLHRDRAQIASRAAFLQPLAHIVVRYDRRLLLEVGIAAGVVAVKVRVDDESNGLVGDAFEGGLDFFGQGRILIIDHHDTVLADGSADVSACAFQHVNIPGNLRDFNFDLAEVAILCRGENRHQQTGPDDQDAVAHEELSVYWKLARDCKWSAPD